MKNQIPKKLTTGILGIMGAILVFALSNILFLKKFPPSTLQKETEVHASISSVHKKSSNEAVSGGGFSGIGKGVGLHSNALTSAVDPSSDASKVRETSTARASLVKDAEMIHPLLMQKMGL